METMVINGEECYLSHAHEWMQKIPLVPCTLVCVRCGTEDKEEECKPHWENIKFLPQK